MKRRWVVLLHQVGPSRPQRSIASDDHWDWMFQSDTADQGRLLTWATKSLEYEGTSIEQKRLDDVPIVCDAMRLPDHRDVYLTKEGGVSGRRGSVTRMLAGKVLAAEFDSQRFVFHCEIDESFLTEWPVKTRCTLIWKPISPDSMETRLTMKRHRVG